MEGLDYLEGLEPRPDSVIPGHGPAFEDPGEGMDSARGCIQYLREHMDRAAEDFLPIEDASEQADWSPYAALPAFQETNQGGTYMA